MGVVASSCKHMSCLELRIPQGQATLKPEIQELLVLLRKALHLVCEELRRTHRCNKHLEERQSDLAIELDELKSRSERPTRRGGAVKVNDLPERIELPQATHALPPPVFKAVAVPARELPAAVRAVPAAVPVAAPVSASIGSSAPNEPRGSAASSGSGDKGKPRCSSDRSSMASSRRVTLKLSRSVLRKLSANAGHAQNEEQDSDSGSEIFEANNPDEVLQMQKILQQLSWKYEYMPEGGTVVGEDGVKPEEEDVRKGMLQVSLCLWNEGAVTCSV